MKRPNILILMSDEHRADVAGYEGNTVVKTPTLDWLAETGVQFRNAYTPSPICVPARQCMASGQLPRTCGAERYGQDLKSGHMTFARLFSQYAYLSIAFGKLHHQGYDQMHGWRRRIGMDDMQMVEGNLEGRNEEAFAAFPKDPSRKWTDSKEVLRAGVGRSPYSDWDDYATLGFEYFCRESLVSPYYDKDLNARPKLLYVGLNNPHYPYFTDEKKFEYYLPRVRPFEDQKPFDHPFLGNCPNDKKPLVMGKDLSEREIRRAMAAYYGNIESNDDRYRRILDALTLAGENLDDWLIIYTSDHGEMLGEHCLWEKQKFFEASVRVPLIVRWPARFAGGRTVHENANLCDLFATFCDAAGLPVPPGLDSRSLLPLLEGNTASWDNESVSQFGGKNIMIKRDNLKYHSYGNDMPEVLFDLVKNPGETVNFADDPGYAPVMKLFRARRKELGF
ncbi:MAG: sulfatase-like hydrolase/transferase [Spirochaetes bacterium]|nr:sulfatase-like hydrolase/transferase [Spirochaetota bacterium]